jgi:predicted Zn-dependent peptidase
MKQVIDRTIQPAIRELEDFSLVRPERRTLRNGITLNVIEAGTGEVVRVDFVIGGGQIDQQQPLQALFTNRMLREGSRQYTSAQIAEKLDYYGAWLDLSTSINCCFVTLYSLNKYFSQTIAVVADMLKHPTYPERELALVVDNNRQQFLVNNERVEVLARKAFNRAFFGRGHAFGRYAELPDYDRITADVLRAYYRTHYCSDNCTLYISGRVTPQVLRALERELGDAPWGENHGRLELQMQQPMTVAERRIHVEREDGLQSAVKMGGFVMDRLHPDYLKAKVMVTLLGGYFGSRLMKNIREDKGYTYGIMAGIVNYPGTSLLHIGTEAGNEYVEPVIAETYREIDRLQQERVGEDELQMVRNYLLGEVCRSYEGPFSLSEAWIYADTGQLGDDYFERTVQAIRQCTADDIQRLAQTWLLKEGMKEVVAGKKSLTT